MAYNNLSGEYYALAAAYEKRGDAKATEKSLHSAIDAAQKAVEVKPDHDKAYVHRGLAREMLGDVKAALADYARAFQVNPQNADAAFYLAIALDQLKRYDEAVTAYDAALAIDNELAVRNRPRVLRAKGNTLMSLERGADAEDAFLRAIEINGNYFDARHDYGVLLAQQGKQNEALEQFLYILRRNPRHVNAKVSLAGLQMRVGNLKGAQRELVEAGMIDPYNKRVMIAAKQWNELKRLAEAATQPTTTPASTTQSAASQSATARPDSPEIPATTPSPADAAPPPNP